MLEIRGYPIAEMRELLHTKAKQGIDRKLERYGVSFSSSGRGKSLIYHITAISNPFKLYCVVDLGIPAQADFIRIRNLYYYFFCVDGFMDLPLVEMEQKMCGEDADISRQCISKWIKYLRKLDYIEFSKSYCDYYAISKSNGQRIPHKIEREEYAQAWAIYFEYRGKDGCTAAYQRMYNYIGGHPYKKPIYTQNAIYAKEIEKLINMIIDTLPTPT